VSVLSWSLLLVTSRVLVGLVLLGGSLKGVYSNPALILTFLSVLYLVFSTLIAEIHPANKTENVRQRAFLTGVMLLASAAFMLLSTLGIVSLTKWMPSLQSKELIPLVLPGEPTWISDPLFWVASVAVGVFLRGPSFYLSLSAISKAGTEGYFAGMGALPFLNLSLEAFATWCGLLPPGATSEYTTLFGIIITAGSLTVLWMKNVGTSKDAKP